MDWVSPLFQMNLVDYAILGVIGLSVIISLIRGFVREAFSLLTWGAALWASVMLTEKGAELLSGQVGNHSLRLMMSFGILFLGVLIIGALCSYLIGLLVKKSGLSGADRLIGLVFGLLRGTLVVTMAIIATGFTPLAQKPLWENSVLIPGFRFLVDLGTGYLPEKLGKAQQFSKGISNNGKVTQDLAEIAGKGKDSNG